MTERALARAEHSMLTAMLVVATSLVMIAW